ncbi:hypothetical protein [Microbacterium sp. G2-8]|uniref:hypothetical protein n=1 Tax=Microbacterium sp. G2-8 TaxID=2842454 RepID=UPI001C8A65CE|nr:hypothetical protein [Microbacterium sp. G2-8]
MNTVRRTVFVIFCACTALFLTAATLLVALQVAGFLALSGSLVSGANSALMPWTLYLAIGMGGSGFAYSYLLPATSDQE